PDVDGTLRRAVWRAWHAARGRVAARRLLSRLLLRHPPRADRPHGRDAAAPGALRRPRRARHRTPRRNPLCDEHGRGRGGHARGGLRDAPLAGAPRHRTRGRGGERTRLRGGNRARAWRAAVTGRGGPGGERAAGSWSRWSRAHPPARVGVRGGILHVRGAVDATSPACPPPPPLPPPPPTP